LLWTGAIGYVVTALCLLLTPIQVVILGVSGMEAAIRYLDYILLSALARFGALAAYAVYCIR
jgi:hypothetical protein